ncbi:MAG: hypothetical protein NC200_04015 [Candidatus Gastranaerophilales bacterium]|nr:hypothetical protein [Candidatus Gastranaerophilales bacterium]
MANTDRINIASYKVLQTLLCLFKKDMTMKELVDDLNGANLGKYNNFVISKYINTCKACGIDIQKINNKYTIINFPIGMRFNARESKLLHEIVSFTENFKLDNGIISTIHNLFNKLHLQFFKSNNGLLSSKNCRIIKTFEKACEEQYQVKIMFKNKTVYKCSPKSINVENGRIFFTTDNFAGVKQINPDDIIDIIITEEKSVSKYSSPNVIFELYGQLAKNYQLKENEQIIRIKDDNTLVVLNKYEKKKELLHRLMRYDSSCKLISPKEYVIDIRDMIIKSIENQN